ncbi:MAG: aminotransferase class V-fold PLP-dependent enzyme, partial [Anaerolineae bacterium]
MKGRKLLMIPGPIEFDPAVLREMGKPTTSHLDPWFMEQFGQALERMREVFMSPSGQPFVVAGTGTLAMDMAGANLIEPGDRALVVNTGYFGDRFGALMERYGAQVDHVRAEVGDMPTLEQVEEALRKQSYKLVTVTQVDTSTGVLADVKGVAALARKYGALVVVDGVC